MLLGSEDSFRLADRLLLKGGVPVAVVGIRDGGAIEEVRLKGDGGRSE